MQGAGKKVASLQPGSELTLAQRYNLVQRPPALLTTNEWKVRCFTSTTTSHPSRQSAQLLRASVPSRVTVRIDKRTRKPSAVDLPLTCVVCLQKVQEKSREREDSCGECVICREEFRSEDQVLLSCSHVFHKQCIDAFERFAKVPRRQKCSCHMIRLDDALLNEVESPSSSLAL